MRCRMPSPTILLTYISRFATSIPISAFNKVDFPTPDDPTKAIVFPEETNCFNESIPVCSKLSTTKIGTPIAIASVSTIFVLYHYIYYSLLKQ